MTLRMSDTDENAAINDGGLRPNFPLWEKVYKLRDPVSGRVIERAGGAAQEMLRTGALELVPWETPSCFDRLMAMDLEQLRAVYDSATTPPRGRGACHRETTPAKALALSLVPYAEAGLVDLEAAHA